MSITRSLLHTNRRYAPNQPSCSTEDEKIAIEPAKKRTKPTKARVQAVKAQIKSALVEWRLRTKKTYYSTCAFGATGVLPDFVIEKVSTTSSLATMDDLLVAFGEIWIYVTKHGPEVLEIVNQLDRDHDSKILARKEEKKRQTALRNEQRRVMAAVERQRQRQHIAMSKLLPSTHQHAPIVTPTLPLTPTTLSPYRPPAPPHSPFPSPLPLRGSFSFNLGPQVQAYGSAIIGKNYFTVFSCSIPIC